MEEFLEHFADFYGSWTLDEIADRFGFTTIELTSEYLVDFANENYDDIAEEMQYNSDEDEEDE